MQIAQGQQSQLNARQQ